jgi:hypothetical protein
VGILDDRAAANVCDPNVARRIDTLSVRLDETLKLANLLSCLI